MVVVDRFSKAYHLMFFLCEPYHYVRNTGKLWKHQMPCGTFLYLMRLSKQANNLSKQYLLPQIKKLSFIVDNNNHQIYCSFGGCYISERFTGYAIKIYSKAGMQMHNS